MPVRDFSEADLNRLEEENRVFWSKLDDETDLGAVLTSGAYFENKLSKCLQHYFCDPKLAEKMLSPTGALGSFVACLDTAKCLRIISDHEHTCLKKVASIRNRFAHDLLTTFDNQGIIDKVTDLVTVYFSAPLKQKIIRDEKMPFREKYVFTCFCIGMELSHREIDVWIHTRSYGSLIPDHLDAVIKETDVTNKNDP